MKKILVMAIAVVFAIGIQAEEVKAVQTEGGQAKKEFRKGGKMSKEEREKMREAKVESDIEYLSAELELSGEQQAKFATTYREFMAERAQLNKKYQEKFAGQLDEDKVRRVMHFHGHGPKDKVHGDKAQCAKAKGQCPKGKGPKGEFKKPLSDQQ